MKPKQQRLMFVGLGLGAMVVAGAIAIPALGSSATYFYSPSDVETKGLPVGEAIRFGGMVGAGSLVKDGATATFRVTDTVHSRTVTYTGLVPDLFRENSGVIAEGKFNAQGVFVADTLLAKHDEKYMPPEVAGALHKAQGKVS